MLMQTCKECVLKCNQETLVNYTSCFCVFQYMELSVPECEEEGLFYCDCTKYTGIPRCHSGMNLKEYFYKVLKCYRSNTTAVCRISRFIS